VFWVVVDEWLKHSTFTLGTGVHALYLDLVRLRRAWLCLGNTTTWLGLGNTATWLGLGNKTNWLSLGTTTTWLGIGNTTNWL